MRKNEHRPAAIAGLLLVLSLAVYGCNTVEGMGQDVSALGRMMTNTAQDTAASLQDDDQQQTAETEQERAAQAPRG